MGQAVFWLAQSLDFTTPSYPATDDKNEQRPHGSQSPYVRIDGGALFHVYALEH